MMYAAALGCFDVEWSPPPTDYYYFAGDSMTWGYAPYETKFATVFETLTGIDSVKCGVTHTGTIHQFAKFREVTAKIGTLPKKVFVGYFFNDTANDYAHPHSTVVDGWLIDDAYLDAGADITSTNTFTSTRIAQADYGLQDYAEEMNREGARLAREAADAATERDGRTRWVAGALGPTNRTASLSPAVNDPGARNVTFDQLAEAYLEAARYFENKKRDKAAARRAAARRLSPGTNGIAYHRR